MVLDSLSLILTAFQRCLTLECVILYLIKLGLTRINYRWKSFYMNATDTMTELNTSSNGLFERRMRWKLEQPSQLTLNRFQICSCIKSKRLFLKRDERNLSREFSKRNEIQSQVKILTILLMHSLREFHTLIMTTQASYHNS